MKNQYESGPLGVKGGIGVFAESNIKGACATILDANPGDNQVTLEAPSDKLQLDRWHMVMANCQQVGGYPPNITYTEYAKVLGIEGRIVTLDRRLKWHYRRELWEDANDGGSIGRARIGCVDRDSNRIIEKLDFNGLDLSQANPSTRSLV